MNTPTDFIFVSPPCHPLQKLRIPVSRLPAAGSHLSIKCPACSDRFDWPEQPESVTRRPPVTGLRDDDDATNRVIIEPRRKPITIENALVRNDERARAPLMRNVPIIKVEYREFRQRCAKTGAPWSAVFHKVGNNEQFVRLGIAAGDRLALELIFARASVTPNFKAERPQAVDFAIDDLVFGSDYACPCCGASGNGRRFVYCGSCKTYTCYGNITWHGSTAVDNMCQPNCPTHPKRLSLGTYDDDTVQGYAMTIWQRDDDE